MPFETACQRSLVIRVIRSPRAPPNSTTPSNRWIRMSAQT